MKRLFFLSDGIDRGDGMGENEGSFEDRGGKGREWSEEGRERREGKLEVLQIGTLGLKRVLEKGFEALRGAESMKMRCRSVWDTSRGLKPSKMGQKCDFARIFFFLGKKFCFLSKRPEQTAGPQIDLHRLSSGQ